MVVFRLSQAPPIGCGDKGKGALFFFLRRAGDEARRMAKTGNKQLGRAKQAKEDEFYTRLEDIERELSHYKPHFRGKTVLCNCDDPRVSNFFHYFSHQFETLGLKRLITTCYKNQDMDLFSRNNCERAIYLVYDGDKNGNRIPDPEEIGIHELKGDGDFRSSECIELLKQADIVVTNPPFSLFREYVAQLIQHDKKFIIIGNQNAITYKEIFPLFMNNKIWLGYGFKRNCAHFITHYEDTATDADHREGMIRVPSVTWFTNLEIAKRHEEMILWKPYTPEDHPHYVNYDAIDVGKTTEIPCDYDGIMGVPITFMYKYNPDQFEIVGRSLELADMEVIRNRLGRTDGGPRFYIEKGSELVRLYDRIAIRRKQKRSAP